MSPPLALGQAVHEVIESLSILPLEKRFEESLIEKFDRVWGNISGKKGGFSSKGLEERYKKRGREMLERVTKNPGPLKNLAVKIKMDLPYFWLSEEDNIILCGKIDWLEYLPDDNSVHIIDFKTGKKQEDDKSLQLPIYHLLVQGTQKRKVVKASYWYVARSDAPIEKDLPDLKDAREKVFKIAKDIKLARLLSRFKCPAGDSGCNFCSPLERVLRGEAELVGVDNFRQDVYILPVSFESGESSVVL